MANELETLLSRIEDEGLRNDLTKSVNRLRNRRSFGLVFEDHLPEMVVLPQHGIRRGTKVVPRGDQLAEPATVTTIRDGVATLQGEGEPYEVEADSLVAIAEFGDPIYPGFKRLGSVDEGDKKPAHTVIKGENYHTLQSLQFTHAGKVDCIYIDPPYNSGARDWKYNNDYVDGEDDYRHSKWLSFIKKRLSVARKLLNPDRSVLIVAIDEKEVHHLGILLQQMFPGCDVQTVTVVTNPAGSLRTGRFTRVEEYLFYVFIGDAVVSKSPTRMLDAEVAEQGKMPTVWFTAVRTGTGAALRVNRTTPVLFYPLYLNAEDGSLHSVGEPYEANKAIDDHVPPKGTIAMWPLHTDGTEQTWRFRSEQMRQRFIDGTVRLGARDAKSGLRPVTYLRPGTLEKIEAGEFVVEGRTAEGALKLALGSEGRPNVPPAAVWKMKSHFAREYGTGMVKDDLLPGREFPFPKSLYAVEDSLRVAVGDNSEAVVLDFFGGSGTTAHAVARLNKQDGGSRRSIIVTNNAVSEKEAKALADEGFKPGDPEWEALGIYDYITRPRLEAAVTGRSFAGKPLTESYKKFEVKVKHCEGCRKMAILCKKHKTAARNCDDCKEHECTSTLTEVEFNDDWPMSDGFAENVQFLELEYLDAGRVELDRAFNAIAPLLWMRAGSVGPVIEEALDSAGRRKPYASSAYYGVLFNPSCFRSFLERLPETATHAFVVTDSRSEFAHIAAALPFGVEAVQLYENYLTTFAINTGGAI